MYRFIRVYFIFSYFLYSISKPDKYGNPTYDLSKDMEDVSTSGLTRNKILLERVIYKVFQHYDIPLEYITDKIRAAFHIKLCGMGKQIAELGTFKKTKQLSKWKNGSGCSWTLTVNIGDANKCLKHQLDQQIAKCQTLERDLESQTTELAKLRSELTPMRELSKNAIRPSEDTKVCQSRKRWQDYSRQHKLIKKRHLVAEVTNALSLCNTSTFTPTKVQFENEMH